MTDLLPRKNVEVLNLCTSGDYWINKQEFCDRLRQIPLTTDIIIDVGPDSLSLTGAMVVPVVEKIIEETGRDPATMYVDTLNKIQSDTPWTRVYHKQDIFSSSKADWLVPRFPVKDDAKIWGVFVGKKTTAELFALFNLYQDLATRQNCILAAINDTSKWAFDHPDMIYDQLDDWLPQSNKMQTMLDHHNFREFCYHLPIDTIEDVTVKQSIESSNQYLFELVFESVTRGFAFSPSNKTVKTILAEKPMVVYAPKDFLKNLRHDGYQTFDSLWDESYDELEGQQRHTAIINLVKEICNLSPAKQLEIYLQSRDICRHNRIVLQKSAIRSMRLT